MYTMYTQVQQGADLVKSKLLLEATLDKETTESMEPLQVGWERVASIHDSAECDVHSSEVHIQG